MDVKDAKNQKTPAYHALWHFSLSILITAIIAGLTSALSAISGQGTISWSYVGLTILIGIIASLGNSIAVYLRAFSQTHPGKIDLAGLAPLIEEIARIIEERMQVILDRQSGTGTQEKKDANP